MVKNLFTGILIGLITGMPFGPIGAVCLKNTLSFGSRYGFLSGLGSAVADTIYASFAALSFIIIEKFIVLHQFYFHIVGGVILFCYGIYNLLNGQTNASKDKKLPVLNSKSLFKAFSSTFLIALANPATIFSFIVVFTGLHMTRIQSNIDNKIALIIGVFIGSMIWWLILVFTAGKFHHKLNHKNSNVILKILSYVIIFSGIIVFLSAFNRITIRKAPILHSKLFEIFFNIKSKIPFHRLR
ncbi:transporter [Clostridium fermenticellae]|uniref:Transporter n=1 Tax=Clostridium fermenticellae TaxID=2068654 RepID=A0A386H5G2_9CLOT|nr:LysE family transporter [Clostridium fermenticellae]AYD40854.1 transporter [Clostridium fermenticellae]